MKISRLWLEKFFDADLPDAQTLADALTFHAFEIDGIERAGNDEVLDVKVTPNRGHDALSHRGIAKELAAILGTHVAFDPLRELPTLEPKNDLVGVSIQRSDLCRRYIGALVKGVKVGPSPQWLQDRLAAIGQRSINNVVDATNFVMFNLGQPLHAFDAGKLKRKKDTYAIEVRLARAGETMQALDEKEYALSESMLVIADANADVAIGIAGVKGGMPAAITEKTKDIVIESANFNGASVRKTAAALKLRTDASARFEQVLSPELAAYGMQSVVELIQKLAGGEVVGYADEYPEPQETRSVPVSLEQINETLGTALTGADVSDAFSRLGLGYKEENGVFEVLPPFERLDLTIAQDLIEEVARIIGYDAVPSAALSAPEQAPAISKNFYTHEKIREFLVSQGFSEVYTSVFAKNGDIAILNNINSDLPFLRSDLAGGLAEALERNVRNKELLGLKQVKLFEIGAVWKGGREDVVVELAVEKVKGQKSAEDYRRELDVMLSALKPAESHENFPLSTATRYQSFSKYPYIVRDIALWVPAGTEAGSVLDLIHAEAGELLVRCELFDRFEKEGRVSLAFRLVFQSFERTLTETEVNAIMEKISAALKAKGFEIR